MNNAWTPGPEMSDDKAYHGCGSFYLNDALVMMVVDNTGTDFLINNSTWITGNLSINKDLFSFRLLCL